MIYTKTIIPIYKLSTAKVNKIFDIHKYFFKKFERTFENIAVSLHRFWHIFCNNVDIST